MTRFPFGVKAASPIFQRIMNTKTSGLSDTAAYVDDNIVAGRSQAVITTIIYERIPILKC